MFFLNLSLWVWDLGKILLIILFLVIYSMTIFWSTIDRTGAIFEMELWGEKQKENLLTTYIFFMSSYMLLTLALGVCTKSSTVIDMSPVEMGIGGVVCLTVLSACIESLPYKPGDQTLKLSCWIVHSLTLAPSLSSFGHSTCVRSILYTAFVVASAFLAGFTAPQNFYERLRHPINILYAIVAATTFITVLICPNCETIVEKMILNLTIYSGISLYFIVAFVNTQAIVHDIKHQRSYDPIFSSAVMFMCTINLYIRISLFLSVEDSNSSLSKSLDQKLVLNSLEIN